MEMIALREEVLLHPIGISSSYINTEKEKDDILIGAFSESGLIGCCILSKLNSTSVQLRQMAVKEEHQGTGVGKAILKYSEAASKERGYHILLLHARDRVVPFYEKNGYAIKGDGFTEVGVPHHKMEKRLD